MSVKPSIDLALSWSHAFAPPDRREIYDWAFDNVTLPPVLTKRGRFSVVGSRHFIAPFQALKADRVRGVRICAPVRGGKTLIADISVPWALCNLNASVLWCFQSQQIAESHAETRQMPIMGSVPAIAPLLPSDRHKKRKADILLSNGLPFIMSGPALGNLQSRGFQWAVADECWQWKDGILGQLKARLGDHVKEASSKFLAISQGGEEDSDWALEFADAHLYTWHVRCQSPTCGKYIAPEWTMDGPNRTKAGMVWDEVKRQDGTYNKDAMAQTARFVCPHCGHAHPMGQRTFSAWNESGAYLDAQGVEWDAATAPAEVSFRWHTIIEFPWRELVKEWLAACEAKHVGNFAPMINFFQKRCALMRSERSIHDADFNYARVKIELAHPVDRFPGEVARFLTADRQEEDVYWVMVRAWFPNGESRRLWYGKLYSPVEIDAKACEFGVPPDLVLVDSGYRPKGDNGVYAACVKYGWNAAKGADEQFFWHLLPKRKNMPTERIQKAWAPLTWADPGSGTVTQGRTRCPLYRFSSPRMFHMVDALIKRGLWVEPEIDEHDEYDRECRIQMAAEFVKHVTDRGTGKRIEKFVCPSGNNHARDCAKMQTFMGMMLGYVPDGIDTLPDTVEVVTTDAESVSHDQTESEN